MCLSFRRGFAHGPRKYRFRFTPTGGEYKEKTHAYSPFDRGFGNAERMRRTFQRLFEVSPHDYRARFRSTLLN